LPKHVRIKSYEFRKIEKVGKNHVPTCPVFAGPVTNGAVHPVMVQCPSIII